METAANGLFREIPELIHFLPKRPSIEYDPIAQAIYLKRILAEEKLEKLNFIDILPSSAESHHLAYAKGEEAFEGLTSFSDPDPFDFFTDIHDIFDFFGFGDPDAPWWCPPHDPLCLPPGPGPFPSPDPYFPPDFFDPENPVECDAIPLGIALGLCSQGGAAAFLACGYLAVDNYCGSASDDDDQEDP